MPSSVVPQRQPNKPWPMLFATVAGCPGASIGVSVTFFVSTPLATTEGTSLTVRIVTDYPPPPWPRRASRWLAGLLGMLLIAAGLGLAAFPAPKDEEHAHGAPGGGTDGMGGMDM